MPELGTKIVGKTSDGRNVYLNSDGSISSHRNVIFGFDQGFAIVPTIYGGKEYSPKEAANIISSNGFVDPDTGKKLDFFQTEDEALAEEQKRHIELDKLAEKIFYSLTTNR